MWSTIRLAAARQLRVGGVLSARGAGRLTSRVATKQSTFAIPSCYRFQLAVRGFAETRGRPPKSKTATKKASGTATKKKPAKRGRKAVAKKAAPKKKRAKRALTEEEKKKNDIRELKKVALLKEPKKLPAKSWLLYLARHAKAALGEASDFGTMAKQLGESFSSLPASEAESLKAAADQNKLANEAAYKSWVESHSPEDIATANRARRRLRIFYKVSSAGPIKDDRQPKRCASGYLMYVKSRWQSGDYSGLRPGEGASKTIADEWNTMTAAERQPFLDSAQLDAERYARESRTILNRSVQRKQKPSP